MPKDYAFCLHCNKDAPFKDVVCPYVFAAYAPTNPPAYRCGRCGNEVEFIPYNTLWDHLVDRRSAR